MIRISEDEWDSLLEDLESYFGILAIISEDDYDKDHITNSHDFLSLDKDTPLFAIVLDINGMKNIVVINQDTARLHPLDSQFKKLFIEFLGAQDVTKDLNRCTYKLSARSVKWARQILKKIKKRRSASEIVHRFFFAGKPKMLALLKQARKEAKIADKKWKKERK